MKPFEDICTPQHPMLMKTVCAFTMFAALCAMFRERLTHAQETYHAHATPPTDGRVGANYTPAYAVNQILVPAWFDNVVVLPSPMLP